MLKVILRPSVMKQLNQLRSYHHLVKNRTINRKLLTIKPNKFEQSNRQMSAHDKDQLLNVILWAFTIFFICKIFGPDQLSLIDKMVDIKFKVYNLISNEKLEVVDDEYLDEIEDSKAEEMCKKKPFVKETYPDEDEDVDEEEGSGWLLKKK